MKRLDEGKTSWVDFLRSIRYTRQHTSQAHDDLPGHFAGFSPQTRTPKIHSGKKSKAEEKSLVRSAN